MTELFRYYIQFECLEGRNPRVGTSLSFATKTDDPAEAMRQAGEYLNNSYGKFKLTGFSGPDGKILVRL